MLVVMINALPALLPTKLILLQQTLLVPQLLENAALKHALLVLPNPPELLILFALLVLLEMVFQNLLLSAQLLLLPALLAQELAASPVTLPVLLLLVFALVALLPSSPVLITKLALLAQATALLAQMLPSAQPAMVAYNGTTVPRSASVLPLRSVQSLVPSLLSQFSLSSSRHKNNPFLQFFKLFS